MSHKRGIYKVDKKEKKRFLYAVCFISETSQIPELNLELA